MPQSDLLELATALGVIPERFDLNWAGSSREAKARNLSLAPTGPPLDWPSFSTFGRAIQGRRHDLHGLTPDVRVLAIVENQDSLCTQDPANDILKRFPRAEVVTVEAGHMAVFEQPSSIWAPSLIRV